MVDDNAGKGDTRRPPAIGREEEMLRWKLAQKQITFDEYECRYKRLKKQGKIIRRF